MAENSVSVPRGLRAFADAWNRGEMDQVLAAYHPDAVVRFIGGFEELIGREFEGREQIAHWFNEWRSIFASEIEIERATGVGDRLLVIYRHTTRGRGGGVQTTTRFGTVIAFQDGLVHEADYYYEVAEAYAAVGVSMTQ